MIAFAIIVVFFSLWLVLDAIVGIWRTRNLFFAWQFVGVSLSRLPLETIYFPDVEIVPLWSLLLGLLGTFGLILGLVAAIISLLTDAQAIRGYIEAKQGRSLWAWLLCIYPTANHKKEETPVSKLHTY